MKTLSFVALIMGFILGACSPFQIARSEGKGPAPIIATQPVVTAFMLPDDENFSLAEMYPVVAYAVGIAIMLIFLAFRYRDVHRWFPARAKKG